MFSLIIALNLVSADYQEAYDLANAEKEPLVVYIGAEWCAACKRLRPKINLIHRNYVYLDYDEETQIVEKFLKQTKNRSIPQLIMWKKKDGVWKEKVLIGEKTEKELEDFFEITPLKPPGEL